MKQMTVLLVFLLTGFSVFSTYAAAPVGKTIWLYYDTTASYVTVDAGDGYRLEAKNISSVGTAEQFVVEQVTGSTNILLKAVLNGQYAKVDTSDTDKLKANTTSTSDPLAQYQWTELGGNVIRLTNIGTGEYVHTGGVQETLRANSTSTGTDTQFTWGEVSAPPPTGARIADTLYSDFDVPVYTIDATESPYNADNTGVTDASAAIQAALDAAAADWGGIVYLPAGDYLLQSPISIPKNICLRGDWKRPTDSDKTVAGTVLYIDHGAGSATGTAAVSLGQSAIIRDLSIYYPGQTLSDPSNPVPYPYTIEALQELGHVRNVTLVNSYQGITTDPGGPGMPTNIGIYGCPIALGCYNYHFGATPRYENIHFEPAYWAESGLGSVSEADIRTAMRAAGGKGISTGSGAGGSIWLDIDLDGYDIGWEIREACSPRIFDLNITHCRIGIDMAKTKAHGWVFIGGSIHAEEMALKMYGNSDNAQFNNMTFSSDDVLIDQDAGTLGFTKCTFESWGSGYAIDSASNDLAVAGCQFNQAGSHIILRSGVKKAVVYANTAAGSLDIQNNSTAAPDYIVIDTISTHTFIEPDTLEYPVMETHSQVPAPPAGDSHVFNVQDYGATGNGVSDDTDEIQDALDAAGALADASAGCIVFFPAGAYRINGRLSVPQYVELRAAQDSLVKEDCYTVLCFFADKDQPNNPPIITMAADSGINGLMFYRPEQTWNSSTGDTNLHAYPVLIEGTDRNWAYNANLGNIYDGIDFSAGGGHSLEFVYSCSLNEVLNVGSDGVLSVIDNLQVKTDAFRNARKFTLPAFVDNGFGDGAPNASQDAGLGDTGTGLTMLGDGTFRCMGHFVNQSGDSLYKMIGSPTLNMYLCGGEGKGTGSYIQSNDGKVMDVEMCGNSYHTGGEAYTVSETDTGDRLHVINCKNYGGAPVNHIVRGDGTIVMQQEYRGAIQQITLQLEDTATGIMESGYYDGATTTARIRTLDSSQALLCGAMTVKDGWDFDPSDENQICVVSVCPDNINGITGSGGVFCTSYPEFNMWADDWGIPRDSETGDYDSDGVCNLIEYALNGDPTNGFDDTDIQFIGDGGLMYIHARRNDDPKLAYRVETSTNLVSGVWTNTGYSVTGTNVMGSGIFYDEITNSIPTTHPQTFIRLNVTR